jgi:glycosyltransferase involved in cell wall biosynthesis
MTFESQRDRPRVSILIPSYNHALYIRETMESILSQDFDSFEVVVVDDASTDATVEIIRSFESDVRLRFFQNAENRGASYTISRALELSRGELIAPFASDDVFLPGRLGAQVAQFDADPDLRFLLSDGRRLMPDGTDGGRVLGPHVAALLDREMGALRDYLLTNSSPLFLQGALIKRDLMEQSGGWDRHVRADDWVLCIRLVTALGGRGRIRYHDAETYLYRIHAGNAAANREKHLRLKREVVDKYTPAHLRSRALSNIYWEATLDHVNDRSFAALKYLVLSQALAPSLARLIQLGRSAVRGLVRRAAIGAR